MAHEAITLDSQSFYVAGDVRPAPAGEWTVGLKIGKATYDERLHAWWLVLDDFSGGIGYRRLDIREALGTVWDNPGGVDLRRGGHVTLPPEQTVTALTGTAIPGTVTYTGRQPSFPIIGSDINSVLANYAGFGDLILRSTDAGAVFAKAGATAAIANAVMISKILEFSPSPSGTNALYVFCEGGGTARYQRSTDGTTWADGGSGTQKVVEDAIVFDEKIIGTAPIAKIIFSFDGQTWNIDTAADAEPIWQANYGRVQFVGLYMAPWGESAVHFLARSDAGIQELFVLDFDSRKAHRIPINNKRHLHDGLVWNNQVIVTDGFNVWAWDGVTVRNIAWPRRGGGLPPGLQTGVIVKFIGGTDYLFALLHTSAGTLQVIAYNGAGWSQLGKSIANFQSVVTGIVSDWGPGTVNTERRIVALGMEGWSGTVTSPRAMTLRLPDTGEVPLVGTDKFEDGPLAFRTGWIDGGFRELSGALYKLHCDGFNIDATETVKIGYRLDNDESAAFTPLGTFTAAGTWLTFPGSGTGLEFRTVQFEITLDRDTTATNSPELESLVLLYDKKPNFRSMWTFRVDVNQMVAEKVQVGGSDATCKNVWEKLIAIWNTKTLVVLNVPSLDTSVYVKIADMPASFDDFRTTVGGKGFVDVTVIEPV